MEYPGEISPSTTPGDTNGSDLAESDLIRVDAGAWGLTWAVRPDGQLAQIGLGPRGHLVEPEVPLPFYPLAYRTWGAGDPYHEAALRVTHADGTLTTRLSARTLTRTDVGDGEHIVLACRDGLLDFTVEHHFMTHPNSGVLEQWIEIEHDEPAPVRLCDYDSLCHFLLVTAGAELCQFGGGGWADEWHWTTEKIHPGIRSLTSLGGVQPHLQASPMLILCPDGPSSETKGTTIGMSIAWGGNTRFHLTTRPKPEPGAPSELVLKAGANPYGAEYTLDPGTRFVTPTVAWTWADGRALMTERFHEWTRARVMRDPHKRRAIVANNWEATFFDFDEQRITDLIGASADLGAEVFLLDDGWFGSEFPRDSDEQGLGDWEVNERKLPGGLGALADAAERAGIRFGIWVEPEMVNPRSQLYRQHPDWVVRDGRDPAEHRWQLLLDPLREEVRDFEVGVFDSTLQTAPSTSYVKWDANRPITDPGSDALPADRQSNLFVDGVRRTWQVMQRVAEGHPEIDLMLCASGGGRNDHGTMRYFHEFWTSDNTDPVTRIRMQWAALHFFPAATVAAHVTRWGDRPFGFACAVALSARFGTDLDLASLTDDQAGTLRTAVEIAKRTQDIIQKGRLIRMVSPVEGDDRSGAALAFVSLDSNDSVVFVYRIEPSGPQDLHLDWLDPTRSYRVNRTGFGESAVRHDEQILDARGIAAAANGWFPTGPLSAEVIELRAV